MLAVTTNAPGFQKELLHDFYLQFLSKGVSNYCELGSAGKLALGAEPYYPLVQ
jgi:hypothetical protein